MRYYAYAHSYHQELYELWSNRMLKNRNVFYYDKDAKIVRGLLGYAVTVWGEEEPGIEASKYHISGLFKRESFCIPHIIDVKMVVLMNIKMS